MRGGLAILILSVCPVAAQDRPETGVLYAIEERAVLNYDCRSRENGQIECMFDQASIRPSHDASQIEARLNELRGQMPPDDEGCELMSSFLDEVESGTAPESWQALDEEARSRNLTRVERASALCDDPTEQDIEQYIAVVRSELESTCRVYSQRWDQTFRRSSPDSWVVTSQPDGACGVIRADRFTRVREGVFGWRFTSQKIVTNRDDSNGGVCSMLDDGVYEYTLYARQHIMDCRFIEMGWF